MYTDQDKAPEKTVIGAESRECGPLDASDVEGRLAKQRPPISLDRVPPGLEK